MAGQVELLSGRKKKDYEAEQAAGSLETQASRLGLDEAADAEDTDAVALDEADEGDADEEVEAAA